MLIACVNQDRGVRPGARKGAAVHLAAMRSAFRWLGAGVQALDEPEPRRLATELERLHAEGPLDLVYERHALDADSASAFCRRHDVPHVLEVNAPLREEAARHRGYVSSAAAERAEGRVFESASLVIAVSSAVARFAVERGASPERVIVRPNGVSTSLFVPRPRAEGPLVLGFFGRLRPWHGFERLVEVVARLLDRGVPLRLEIVGEGDFLAHLAGRVPPRAWRHTPWLPQADLAERVAGFDALALTYAPDADCYFSPLKLLEAMAAGVVPCVPALGDLRDVVQHDVNGLVHDPRDLGELEQQLASLAVAPELRARLGAAAHETAQEHSWECIARDVLSAVGLDAVV